MSETLHKGTEMVILTAGLFLVSLFYYELYQAFLGSVLSL